MRLLGVGDNIVDRYVDLDTVFPGGNALNVAVFARRAAAAAAYLGAVGDDDAGRLILGALETEGVETTRVRVLDGRTAQTNVSLVDGDRAFSEYDAGVSKFRLSEDDLAYAASFDVIHTGNWSYLELQVPDLAMTGRPVSFDFSIRREPEYLDALLPWVQIACFSASDLAEDEVIDFLHAATDRGPRLALATRGAKMTLLHTGDRTWSQPVLANGPVLDTLGAGDSFIGRFLVGAISGEDPQVTLEAAARASAATCYAYGAFGRGGPIQRRSVDVTAADAGR